MSKNKCKDRKEMSACCLAIKTRFTLIIGNFDSGSACRKLKLVLSCERSGEYKGTKKKLKLEDTGSRKDEYRFKLRDYFSKEKYMEFLRNLVIFPII